MKNLEPRLFGTSGIRGLVNKEIDSKLALDVGLAISTLFPGVVTVGRDSRLSGDMLSSAIISGLLACGCDVRELGILPTPALAYITKTLKASCGVMITASHNPPEFNGIKLFGSDGSAHGESTEQEIERLVRGTSFHRANWADLHESTPVDESSRYVSMIADRIKLRKKWTIALDTCNGAASTLGSEIMRKIGCRVISSNAQTDPKFLGRSPEPSANSLKFLSTVVSAHKCEIGIACDGDADRVAVVDEKGRYIEQDLALASLAGHIASRSRGGVFAFPIDASLGVKESVEKQGGEVIWTRVGDVYVADAIRTHKAVFGGEPSGAWIHPSYHLCPDGLLSGAILLSAIEESGGTASSFFSSSHAYHVRRGKVNCPNSLKESVVIKCATELEKEIRVVEVTRLDGVRLSLEDSWVLVRASGTEPAVRITAEARIIERAVKLFETAMKLCEKAVKEEIT